ncbi:MULTISPECIES: ParA family protein [Cysteiniphilum]|uniref:Chromosome partitioning protein ParA n=1 Tax=Cysteiniphilum litorale TaxID=2056700 RepID=A0A8J2Z320_9GAMM|nr:MULTISPECIES: ParA family protein [Cysteiniphilum]GGF92111.1 chromosome partitioning protein ParA [Cysteiniphilum litorale]
MKGLPKGKVIAVSQSKGGACKTTTAVNLVGALNELGFKSIVLDIDTNKPDASVWASTANKITFVKKIEIENILDETLELKPHYDYIVFDCPPNYLEAGLKGIMLSDFVILPASPSFFDQANLKKALDAVKIANKDYRILASRIKKNTTLAGSAYDDIQKTGHGFKTFITNRTVMEECGYAGQWIGEYEKNGDNHKQFINLANEVIDLIG